MRAIAEITLLALMQDSGRQKVSKAISNMLSASDVDFVGRYP